MNCPRCGSGMERQTLAGQLDRQIDVDLCKPCQSLWFDGKENLQLTPGATLSIFRSIGEHVHKPELQDSELVKCPRCNARLRRTQDLQRATRFEYFRCPNNHGRLITFFDFLKEKDFIRPLTPQQINELRKNVQIINCSNCGAPIDLTKTAACSHCGSPLSMLDMNQAERLVAQLQAAESASQNKTIDPALPLALAKARIEVDRAFKGVPGHDPWTQEGWALGLVGAGLSEIIRLIKRNG
jgi:DNA-directed RNA polymerase subunit RPC12/RpoP